MAISIVPAIKLVKEVANGTIKKDAVLTLGRQDICFTRGLIHYVMEQHGLPVPDESRALPSEEAPPMEEFFTTLGFGRVESLDVTDYENCSIVHDMNLAVPKGPLTGAFSLIVDGGTMEHVFNVPMFLSNVHDMLAVDGIVFHHVPVNGWVDHGFYQFSPVLFYGHYVSNKYDLISIDLIKMNVHNNMTEDEPIPYVPGTLNGRVLPEQDKYWYMCAAMCRKTPESTSTVSPYQVFSQGKLAEISSSAH